MTCFSKQLVAFLQHISSPSCALSPPTKKKMTMTGADLISQLPNELWVFTLFGTGSLESDDVMNFFLSTKGTAKFGDRIVEDSFTLRKWRSLLPYKQILQRGWFDVFLERYNYFSKKFYDGVDLLTVLLTHPEIPNMIRAAKIIISHLDNNQLLNICNKVIQSRKTQVNFVFLQALWEKELEITIKQYSESIRLAIIYDHEDLFDLIWSKYESFPDIYKQGILFLCCQFGRLRMVHIVWGYHTHDLVRHCLQIAIQRNHTNVAMYVKNNYQGAFESEWICIKTLKHLLARAKLDFVKTVLQWAGLVEDSILLQDPSNWFTSKAYVFAATHSNLDVYRHVRYLLYNTLSDEVEKKAFLNACKSGNLQVVKYLMQMAENEQASETPEDIIFCKDNIAFREAASCGKLYVVQELLKHPRVFASSHQSFALRKAAANGHFDTVRLLASQNLYPISRRSRIDAKDFWAIRKALEAGHYMIAEYLCKRVKKDIEDFY